ncbi:MAG: phosphoribosyltransferase [Burkholderiales bacterium]
MLALPRGGVPVAAEIAHELHAPLDIVVVRKLGTPGHEELAMGAIASRGARVLNDRVIADLGISNRTIERVAVQEQAELDRRMKAYRASREWPVLEDKHVILVDDGVATGATMRAAIAALRAKPAEIIVAVPVAPAETLMHLRREADRVVCLATPEPFNAISLCMAAFLSFRMTRCAAYCASAGTTRVAPPAKRCLRIRHPGTKGTRGALVRRVRQLFRAVRHTRNM